MKIAYAMFTSLFAATLSGAMLLGAIYFFFEQWQFVQRGKIVKGVVTDSVTDASPTDGDYLATTRDYAVIAFQTEDGQTIQFTSTLSWGTPKIGKQIMVIYDPSRPEKAEEYSFFGLWGLPLFIVLFVTPIFIFSIRILFSALKHPAQ